MAYAYLALAIVAEVAGTLALRASDGFSKPLPSVVVVLGYAIAFFLLALTLKELSVGVAYAIWAGVGTALVAIGGVVVFGESLNLAAIACLGLIVLGVIGLNLSGAGGH